MAVSPVADLMAIATVRRLLLELGHELQPEAPGTLVGPLSLWIHQPRPQLNGKSPMQALAEPGGEALLKNCLREFIAMAGLVRGDPVPPRTTDP